MSSEESTLSGFYWFCCCVFQYVSLEVNDSVIIVICAIFSPHLTMACSSKQNNIGWNILRWNTKISGLKNQAGGQNIEVGDTAKERWLKFSFISADWVMRFFCYTKSMQNVTHQSIRSINPQSHCMKKEGHFNCKTFWELSNEVLMVE